MAIETAEKRLKDVENLKSMKNGIRNQTTGVGDDVLTCCDDAALGRAVLLYVFIPAYAGCSASYLPCVQQRYRPRCIAFVPVTLPLEIPVWTYVPFVPVTYAVLEELVRCVTYRLFVMFIAETTFDSGCLAETFIRPRGAAAPE